MASGGGPADEVTVEQRYPYDNVRRLDRLETLSDVVTGVTMVLVVATIALPDFLMVTDVGSFFAGLVAVWTTILTAAISFLLVAVFWSNHHHLCRYIQRTDQPFLMLNALYLLMIAFLPYPTRLLGLALTSTVGNTALPAGAALFYGISVFLVLVALAAAWLYAVGRGKLVVPYTSGKFLDGMTRGLLAGCGLSALAIVLALVTPWASMVAYFAVVAWFFLPRRYDPFLGGIVK